MPSHETPDPKKALDAYQYPQQADDDKIISQVETQIKIHFPVSYTAGLAESAAEAPIKKSDVEEQKKKYEDRVAKAKKDHPDEIKKEAQEGHTPKLDNGPPANPKVKEGDGKQTQAKEPAKGGKGEGTKHEKGEAKPKAIPPEKVPSAPAAIVLAAPPGSDKDLDQWLDGYPNKGKESLEKVSKIKEMASIAKGFDGQVEGYVKKGDGLGESVKSVMTWIGGKKEINAAFGENPYEKVGGGLGLLMQGVSRIQNVVSIVGNVVGKIGLVLTIVGILAMIVPPIGAAIEAVAKVLNTIGIICDLIGLGLSGVLVGLNGVHLAEQIAKGASPEEKAATADMMMEEANAAGGHILSLAMQYGPKFMKGFKGASGGIIKKLFTKFKTTVGKWATKIGGPALNFAKKAAYKMGIGLEKDAAPGLLARGASAVKNKAVKAGSWMANKAEKAWNAPGKLLERAQDNRFTNWASKKVAGGVSKFTEKFEQNSFVKGVNKIGAGLDEAAENAGSKLGGWKGGGSAKAKALNDWADTAKKDVEERLEMQRAHAGQNAANRENARIDKAIGKAQKGARKSVDDAMEGAGDDAVRQAERYVDQAETLEEGRAKSVAKEQKTEEKHQKNHQQSEEKAEQKREARENKEKADEEAKEDKLKDELQSDPGFKANQRKLEEAEEKRDDLKKQLNKVKSPKAKKRLEEQYAENRHEIAELRQRPAEARGGEAVKSFGDLKEKGMEWWNAIHGKDENDEKKEEINKEAEENAGIAEHEKEERKEGSEHIADWAEHEAPAPAASEQANAMLEGLDEDLEEEADDDAADLGGDEIDGAGDGSESDAAEPDQKDAGDQPAAAAPAADPTPASVPDEGGGAGSESPPAPAPANEEKKDGAPGADMPELAYWPALAGDKGKFAESAHELTRMKQYAFAFQKAQIEARRKAIESYRAFASAADIEAMNKRNADKQAKDAGKAANKMDENADNAGRGSGEADKAGSEQDKSKSQTKGGPPDVPDVGEKPGWTHPIKRCYWYIKKWIAEKAAKVFGWIQEKIASMVLMGLCGVSMGQLKQYTEALRRRMKYGAGAGKKGEEKGNEAAAKSDKNEREGATMKDQALYDVQDCDNNIHDADAFVKDVDATEKDLAAEQARATQFIEAYHAAVKAERAKMAQEQEKKKAAAAQAAPAAAPRPAPTATPSAGPAPTPAPAARPKRAPGPPEARRVSGKAKAKIHGAARFVMNQANVVIEQLITSKQSQEAQLKDKLERNKNTDQSVRSLGLGAMSIAVMSAPPAKSNSAVIDEAKNHLGVISTGMQMLTSGDIETVGAARNKASIIRSAAQSIDQTQTEAFQALNKSFKDSYTALAS